MRVLIAMSGGVDSSVAAMLLKENGHELVGVTFCNYDAPAHSTNNSISEAQTLAKKLGIEHHVLDVKDCFRNTVIQNFIEEYLNGRTPNPCTVCNHYIKWGLLLKFADEMQCQKLATGHYAQVREENDRFFIRKGSDNMKDQSYFLWKLTQNQLQRTIFPLGEYTKPEIKAIAAQLGYVQLSEKKESQEICFISNNDYRTFLAANVPDYANICRCGNYLDTSGKIIGTHQGYPNYTIGQRKGLGIALGVPAYVVAIHPEENEVVIGTKEDLAGTSCMVKDINLMKYETIPDNFSCTVRIRYRSQGETAHLFHEANGIRCEFKNAVESITKGQSAVFYEGPDIVGGGTIV